MRINSDAPRYLCLSLLPNIFVPQVRIRTDEFAHHANAFRIVDNHDGGAVLPEQIFSPQEISILSNYDAGNPEQQGRTRTHDARTQSADQGQLRPVATPPRVAQANRFRVRRGIAALHAQIVSSRHNLTLPVRQNRADRQATFALAFPRLFKSRLQ